MTSTSQPAPGRPAGDPAGGDPVIQVRDVRMAYGGVDVLHGIDLDIHRGEIFALLGPNGAGKTTTVEILEGFRKRSAGEVRVLGTDPAHGGDAWRARIGLVLQSWRDHRRWRVAELLTHFAGYYPDPREPAALLALVGLAEQRGKRVDQLSGGQRRRLDVALALVGRPELLFLDEPTTGFDPEARRDFHVLVERLARDEGVTVLLTTHDLVEAERLADRIAVLVKGRIRARGTPAELAARAAARAEVRWTAADGTARRARTADPSGLVWDLHQETGGPIAGLEVRRPTLEDTYLHMVRQEDTGADADGGAGGSDGADGRRDGDVPTRTAEGEGGAGAGLGESGAEPENATTPRNGEAA
ncbi:ABC transporter ATP-binding protein [Streptomyces sp. Pv4-95]|uniref:ABC transporter ATP-binding protein n=1 Tax=Streptomyces sp. Pv4-95 TaxID=3049543 RepID=UPI003892A7FE